MHVYASQHVSASHVEAVFGFLQSKPQPLEAEEEATWSFWWPAAVLASADKLHWIPLVHVCFANLFSLSQLIPSSNTCVNVYGFCLLTMICVFLASDCSRASFWGWNKGKTSWNPSCSCINYIVTTNMHVAFWHCVVWRR